ncbi:beta-mannosidase [Mediterraneibacter agrestimuris]|uniref:beta-mannosidase n=1 Tax=Mediterraneibacter agrestimuris TaxID=2941333 RepID=UPI00203BB89D|nr:glycoside hydrolase family 2 protein [Mediterraneibacter agrestimuris]
MIQQVLNQNWKMGCAGNTVLPAVVPGTVYTDLLRNGQMEDPFWKDNEIQALELMEEDYEYVCSFACEEALLSQERVLLHFDGLDTIADIYVNEQKVGKAFNMHRIWEYDVTGIVHSKENVLRVLLHSPLQYIREAFEKCRTMGSEDAMDGFVHLRKAHCMFGWDWGAHLPDAGIFRNVSLLGITAARLDSVYIRQEHSDRRVELHLEVQEELTDLSAEETVYSVEITDPAGSVTVYEDSPETITLENPKLWWPNGYGEQPLYTVKVALYKAGQKSGSEPLDIWERRIGLRTMTMKIEKDQWGECFAHEVNGIAIFAMGADYIPEDHLLGRVTPETTRKLLIQCKAANFNTVRVWGGGYYPEDWFFDICDELGLVVWQDFMFACAVYELSPEFKANIRQEFIDNVKRLRHHASLGLWCGNNEMEMFVEEGHHWVTKKTEVRDYIIMYEQLIPEVLEEYDPQTFYWPASPSSGGAFDEPNSPDRGDVHYWKVWHGNRPFSEYRKFFFRYASEFGFQSFPSKKTIETFTDDPKDFNIFSYVMEKHQRQYGANGKIMNYLQQTYLYPTSFEVLLYASQLLQADAIRYGVEHFRRNRGRCMGAIYWQLNDCWPVISWASIDYCGRWKALHYAAKRFFAPLMLSCQEEGMMTQEADMNREHFVFEKSIRLNVANETMEEKKVVISWAVRNSKAEIIRDGGRQTITVPALTSVWLDKVLLPGIDIFSEYVSYEMECDGEFVSDGTVIFSYPKYFRYEDPQLSCRVEGDEIVVSANAYAKSVEILNENEDIVLSDNYFDMNAGEKRVKIMSGKPGEALKLRSVYDIR